MKAIPAIGGVLLVAAGPASAANIVTGITEVWGFAYASAGSLGGSTQLALNGNLYTASTTTNIGDIKGGAFSTTTSSLRIGKDSGRFDFDINTSGLNTQALGSIFTMFRLSANNLGNQPVNLYLDMQMQGMSTSITWLGSPIVPSSSGAYLKFRDDNKDAITFGSGKGVFTSYFPNQSGPTCENRFGNGNAERACFWGAQTSRKLIGVLEPGGAYILDATLLGDLDIDDIDAASRGYNATYSMTGLRFGFSAEDIVTPPPPPIPEPATWMMLIAGFGMAGAAMRRRTLHARFA